MPREKITGAVRAGRTLVSDGAWGTFLTRKGMKAGECPELWNVEHPDDVKEIGLSYIAAGAEMLKTNSIGGSLYKLQYYGLAERMRELNRSAATISRDAAGDGNWVLGSMGPTGKLLLMEEVTEEELYESFRNQAMALEVGGADAALIETMIDVEEACIAIRAVKENTALEVICTFTFEKNGRGEYRTMMGVKPDTAMERAIEAGVDIVGTNCGNGMERMVEIVREMRAVDAEIPILVHANAGLPTNIDGKDVFPDTPELMARFAIELIGAGANIVGGCCGTTPEHIRAIRTAVDQMKGRG